MKPLFDELADATLERVQATYCHTNGRGAEYGDTWGDCSWVTLRATIKVIAEHPEADPHICLVAMGLACFMDQKYHRQEGGYKDDTLVDLGAYLLAYTQAMKLITEGEEQDDRDNTAGD